jgi:hypothetical protein
VPVGEGSGVDARLESARSNSNLPSKAQSP